MQEHEGHTPLDLLVVEAFDEDLALFLVAHGARVNEISSGNTGWLRNSKR